jgi:hypothetical protein
MSRRRILAVLIALAVATWCCWAPALPKHVSLPRWPLGHMSKIG